MNHAANEKTEPGTGDVAYAMIADRYADEHPSFFATELGRLRKRTVSMREARANAKLFLGKEWVSGHIMPQYGGPRMLNALETILTIHDTEPKHLTGITAATLGSVRAAVDALGCLRAGDELRCGVLVQHVQAMLHWHAAKTHRTTMKKLKGSPKRTPKAIRDALRMSPRFNAASEGR